PVLGLTPTIAAAVAIAWRLAGRDAVLIVLLLAVFGLPGMAQFRPARIDHHNVQIALSLIVVAATVWSDRVRAMGWIAGALTGLTLAIGFEGLPLLALCGAAFALRYVLDPAAASALRRYGVALAASMFFAFFVSVGPAHWTESVCDEIAINSTAAVVTAALGLAMAATWLADAPGSVGCAAAAFAAAASLAAFVLLEPRCLGGPYALMDPALKAIWLAHDSEMQSLAELMKVGPTAAVAMAAFPAVALIAVAWLAAR